MSAYCVPQSPRSGLTDRPAGWLLTVWGRCVPEGIRGLEAGPGGQQRRRQRVPPSKGPRLPIGRVLEIEDGPVRAGAKVHRVRGMDGAIEVGHRAEIVPRRVHEQPAAQAALSQPPE
jgi:hypothetical protein